jgi:hypothetical protein
MSIDFWQLANELYDRFKTAIKGFARKQKGRVVAGTVTYGPTAADRLRQTARQRKDANPPRYIVEAPKRNRHERRSFTSLVEKAIRRQQTARREEYRQFLEKRAAELKHQIAVAEGRTAKQKRAARA